MRFLPLIFVFIFFSCRKHLTHERWISNASSDTVFVFNPDFEDTLYIIAPNQKSMIYSYKILDKKQAQEFCYWMGDTLLIYNSKDSINEKPVGIEYNWFSNVTTDDKGKRTQVCTFTLYDTNF